MSKRKLQEIGKFIKSFLETREIQINKLILFGSYARGNNTKDSDIDIAIVSQRFSRKDIFERARMLKGLHWALVEKFELPFDIVPISLDEWKKSFSPIVGFAKQGKNLLA